MKAVWFSRHNPTPEQIQNASEMGFEIVGIEEGEYFLIISPILSTTSFRE